MTFDHFSIRLVRPGDAKILFKLFDDNRKRLEDFFAGTVSKTRTFDDTQNYLAEIITRIESKTYYPYLVIDNDTQRIAGFVDIKNIDWAIPKAELGFFVDAAYAAKGVSSKALRLICDHFFTDLNFDKLFLRTHPENVAARKLAGKTGFVQEGVIRHDYKTTAGEIVDLIYYGKLRDVGFP